MSDVEQSFPRKIAVHGFRFAVTGQLFCNISWLVLDFIRVFLVCLLARALLFVTGLSLFPVSCTLGNGIRSV